VFCLKNTSVLVNFHHSANFAWMFGKRFVLLHLHWFSIWLSIFLLIWITSEIFVNLFSPQKLSCCVVYVNATRFYENKVRTHIYQPKVVKNGVHCGLSVLTRFCNLFSKASSESHVLHPRSHKASSESHVLHPRSHKAPSESHVLHPRSHKASSESHVLQTVYPSKT